jgi:hypothetical protein
MSTNRTSIFAYVAVASLAVAATSLTASEAAAGMFCGRSFAGAFFGGPRSFSPAMPAYRERFAARRPSHLQSKPVAVSEPVKVAPRKPVATPEPVKLASTAGATNIAQAAGTHTAAAAVSTCLTKQYLETGAVMFKDTCTNEWAINSTNATTQAGSSASRVCLTKENHPDGVVMFRDSCTNEWAMNTVDQLAELPQSR